MAMYKIQQGDTLSQIAEANGTTVDELAKLNNISNVNLIHAGDTLKLPDIGTSSTNTTGAKSYSDIDLSKYNSGYQKSDDVIKAETNKSNAENAVSNYGDFAYSDQATFDDVMNKILNREKFSYDLNGDALYQQYKDKYIQQGKMAMQDTMGQAAAMTGGYGNSYAATAGNQAYQASLENLNDIIPELYQMAYDKYKQEGQDLLNQYSLLSDDRNMEYGMWGDKYNQLVADRDYSANEANNAYAKDYGEWSDSYNRDYNQYWQETNFGYGQDRDAVADKQWETEFEEAKRQYENSLAFQKEQYANEQALAREKFEYQKAQDAKKEEENTTYTYTETENTKLFKAAIRTKTEFLRSDNADKKKYGTYEKYIEGMLDKWLTSGKLSEDDVATLIANYGL